MRYFKDDKGAFFGLDDDLLAFMSEIGKMDGLIEVTEYETLTKEQKIEVALSALKSEKEEKLKDLIVPYKGVDYDANERSQIRIAGAVTLLSLAPPETSLEWVDANDEIRTLNAQDLTAIGASIAEKLAEITLDYVAKKAAAIAKIEAEEAGGE
jgi:hypothetical protein